MCGLPGALSLKFSVAVSTPTIDGVKVIFNWQDVFWASWLEELVQLLKPIAKSAALVQVQW